MNAFFNLCTISVQTALVLTRPDWNHFN